MSGNDEFDVAVVGGGPGGSACALSAARMGLSVVLFEPQPGGIDKPCGEGCMASGVAVLRDLGFDALIARALPLPGVRYTLPGSEPLYVPFPSPGLSLPRHELSAAFDAAIDVEPQIERVRAAAQASRSEAGFELRAGSLRIRSRTLVAADGSGGRSAEWLRGSRWDARRRFGLRARCERRDDWEGVWISLGDPHCQVYVTPLPDARLNVALLLDEAPGPGSARALLEKALANEPLNSVAGGICTQPEVRALARRRPASVAQGGAFLVGDAAGAVDPVVGCGVSIALASGMAAADGARRWCAGEPPSRIERDYARHVRAQTQSRERLAALLLALARRPRLARVAFRAFSLAPSLAAALARVAEGQAEASSFSRR